MKNKTLDKAHENKKNERFSLDDSLGVNPVYMYDPEKFFDSFYPTSGSGNTNKNEERKKRFQKKTAGRRNVSRLILLTTLLIVVSTFFLKSSGYSSFVLLKTAVNGTSIVKNQFLKHFDSPEKNETQTTNKTENQDLIQTLAQNNWLQHLSDGHFTGARNILESMKNDPSIQAKKENTIAQLEWIVDLEQYSKKFTPSSPVHIFKDEYRIASLLTVWEENKRDILNLLNRISENDSSNWTKNRVYTNLDLLQSKKYLFFETIGHFKTRMEELLAKGSFEKLHDLLVEFERDNPAITGIQPIKRDLPVYKNIWLNVQANHMDEARRLFSETRFESACMKQKAHILITGENPTDTLNSGSAGNNPDIFLHEMVIIDS
jgi:hypothetical protein